MDLPQQGAARPARSQPNRAGRWSRGFSGTLAAGMVVLTLVLLGAQFMAARSGNKGPGTEMVLGHAVVSIAVLSLQAVADRRAGRAGVAAVIAVLAVVFGALCYWWWL